MLVPRLSWKAGSLYFFLQTVRPAGSQSEWPGIERLCYPSNQVPLGIQVSPGKRATISTKQTHKNSTWLFKTPVLQPQRISQHAAAGVDAFTTLGKPEGWAFIPRSTPSPLLVLKCPFFYEIRVRRDGEESIPKSLCCFILNFLGHKIQKMEDECKGCWPFFLTCEKTASGPR